ncbi:hypothetical protein P0D88_13770 [Paraburkholderia sp. RL18-103-BIB-C]|jgi:hypothetical protein|uniref:hypothetical protein n=1 Tax=unclassified Paraburkholderia TaxID=2615204 RepID=UPI0038B727B3
MGYILRIEDHSFSIVSQSQSDQEPAHWHRGVAPGVGWLRQTATPADKAKAKANSEKSETQATANKKKTEAQSDAVKTQASANEN